MRARRRKWSTYRLELPVALEQMAVPPMLGPKSAKWYRVQNHRRGRWRSGEEGESLFRRVAGDILKEHGIEIDMDEPLPSPAPKSVTSQEFSPEQIATQLGDALVQSDHEFFAAYFQAIHPDEAEQTRMMLHMHLFPVIASNGVIHITANKQLSEVLRRAHDVYLGRFREQERLVRLGDYVVWRTEREAVARELQKKFNQLVQPSEFDTHEIRYGTMLRAVASVRIEIFATDIAYGMSQGKSSEERFALAFRALGTSFTKQVAMPYKY